MKNLILKLEDKILETTRPHARSLGDDNLPLLNAPLVVPALQEPELFVAKTDHLVRGHEGPGLGPGLGLLVLVQGTAGIAHQDDLVVGIRERPHLLLEVLVRLRAVKDWGR